jgi:hypothetical protein
MGNKRNDARPKKTRSNHFKKIPRERTKKTSLVTTTDSDTKLVTMSVVSRDGTTRDLVHYPDSTRKKKGMLQSTHVIRACFFKVYSFHVVHAAEILENKALRRLSHWRLQHFYAKREQATVQAAVASVLPTSTDLTPTRIANWEARLQISSNPWISAAELFPSPGIVQLRFMITSLLESDDGCRVQLLYFQGLKVLHTEEGFDLLLHLVSDYVV